MLQLSTKKAVYNFHKNYNILSTKEDSILYISFYLVALCNFIFCVLCVISYHTRRIYVNEISYLKAVSIVY
jgi:hypothetical protein